MSDEVPKVSIDYAFHDNSTSELVIQTGQTAVSMTKYKQPHYVSAWEICYVKVKGRILMV